MIKTFLLVLHIIVTLTLACAILAQKSEGGLGLGGGANMSLFTARGAANLLTRITAFLATIFLGNCILMSALTNKELKEQASLLDTAKPTKDEINNRQAEGKKTDALGQKTSQKKAPK